MTKSLISTPEGSTKSLRFTITVEISVEANGTPLGDFGQAVEGACVALEMFEPVIKLEAF